MSGQCVFKVNGKSQVSNLHTVSSTLVICISPQGEDEALVQLSYDGIGETTSVQIQRDKLPEIETGLPKMRGVETGGGVRGLACFSHASHVTVDSSCPSNRDDTSDV